MKCLVTGGGGFLGKYIVRELVEKKYNVRIFCRGKYPELEALGVEVFNGDLKNYSEVEKAVKNVDVVFHVAAKAGVWGSYNDFYSINVTGTDNMLEACIKNNVKKLIYTSSPSVVFNNKSQEGIDESFPYPELSSYISYYPKTKAIAEKKVLEANGNNGLLTVALRPHLIWGPEDNHLIPRVIERAKTNRLRIVGNGKNLVDVVYVENAAKAHLLACDNLEKGSSVCGSAYFISQGEPVYLWDFINEILEGLSFPLVKKSVSFKSAYAAGAFFEFLYKIFFIKEEPVMTRFVACQLAHSHYFNISRAKDELDYKAFVSTEEGLKRLIKYYKTKY